MMLAKTLTNKTCLLSGLLISTAFIAQAQSGLNGYWDLRLPNTDGSFRHTYLELNASGETVSGKLFGRNVGGQAIEGTLKADKIRFSTVPPYASVRWFDPSCKNWSNKYPFAPCSSTPSNPAVFACSAPLL